MPSFTRKNYGARFVKRGRGTRKSYAGMPKRKVIAKAVNKQWRKKVATVAKKVIMGASEKKVSVWNSTLDLGVYGYTAFSTSNIIDVTRVVLNPITQGVQQGDRIGNKIRTSSCWFKGILYPAQFNAGNTGQFIPPVEVKLWIVSLKQNPNNATVANVDAVCASDFFQNGNTNQGMLSNLTDIIMPVNMNTLHCYYQRSFKIGTAFGSNNVNNAVYGYGNNDFNLNAKFNVNLTKYLPKNVNYDDGVTQPLSKKIFMVFEAVYANGVTPVLPTTTQFCQLESRIEYRFTDM